MTRLLLDANVSPALAAALRWRGHDALHVNDLGLRAAPDDEIFRTAATLGRAVVTHDGDYLRLLRDGAARPSVIHLTQRELQRDPLVGRLAQALALGEVLRVHGDRLERGAAVRVDRAGSRVEPLPPDRPGPDQSRRSGPDQPRRCGPDQPHRSAPDQPHQAAPGRPSRAGRGQPQRTAPDRPHRAGPADPGQPGRAGPGGRPALERVRARELPGPGGRVR